MRVRNTLALTVVAFGLNLFGAGQAAADPPCGRGWRKHEPCGPAIVYRPPAVVYAPPPVVYAPPPPVMYAPPPPVVYAPPAPGASVTIDIPLR